jgi:hypothetical protein
MQSARSKISYCLCLWCDIITVIKPCDGGVLWSNITVREMDDVVLPCYTTINKTVAWYAQRVLHFPIDDLIFASEGVVDMYEKTGRYSVPVGAGYYNLTIHRVMSHEAGRYRCSENNELGPDSFVVLSVYGLSMCTLFNDFRCFVL